MLSAGFALGIVTIVGAFSIVKVCEGIYNGDRGAYVAAILSGVLAILMALAGISQMGARH